MRAVSVVVVVMLASCARGDEPHRTTATAPATRIATVTETLHGVEVVDNYRWLEGVTDNREPTGISQEVSAWTEAQNSYTRAVLDNLPGRAALEDRLRRLMNIGSVTEPIVRGNRYFYARRAAGTDQTVVCWREGSLGAERVLLDPFKLDERVVTTVAWFSPSEDGRLLAFGIHGPQSPVTVLRLMEVDTGKVRPLDIPGTPEGVQWLPNGSGFVYQHLKDPADRSSVQGRFHRLGTSPSTDLVVSRAPFSRLSRDGKWLVLAFGTGPTSNDLWLANFESFRKTGRLVPLAVSVGAQGRILGTVVGNTLLLHTTRGAPNGRVVAVAASDPREQNWRALVPERADAVVEGVAFGRGVIAVTYRKNAYSTIEVFDMTGKPMGQIAQPGIGVASLAADEDRTDAYLTFTSFNYPPSIFRVELDRPTAAPRPWASPDAPIDPASLDVEQVWYASKDGTKVSMFLVHKKLWRPSGDAPTILAGFGGFGAAMTPSFSSVLIPWFEAGGLFAVPNVRGGGEYGEAWHNAGRLGRKQTAVDDLLAAADWLIANKHTSPAKLALYGGTHGGLLVGAAITQRPDRFRAAVMLMPVLDMLRYQHVEPGRGWVTEYGSADDPDAMRWLSAYSPYHHVKPRVAYPAVLLTALEQGGPVPALHARKMAAALQAASASDPTRQPILLRVDRPADAPSGTVLQWQLRDAVDQRIFLMWQLGVLDPAR
jgi:prolyl oligopeptidase